MKKRSAVALDGGSRVIFGESQIEVALAVAAGGSACAGGESVHEPGELAKLAGAKDGEFRLDGGMGWHMSMLTEGMWSGRCHPDAGALQPAEGYSSRMILWVG